MLARLRQFLFMVAKGLLPLIVFGSAVGIFIALLILQKDVPVKPPQERVWNVFAQKIHLGNIQPILKVFGEVVAGRQVELRAFVSGDIIKTNPNLREGGIVQADDEILRIDPFTYQVAVDEAIARLSQARARLEELIAQLKQEEGLLIRAEEQALLQERALDRAKTLSKSGHISQKTLDDASLAYSKIVQVVEMRKSSLSIQQARIIQQEAAVSRSEIALALAERDLTRTSLKAPFRGFLNQINASEGRFVNSNDRVAILIDADQLEVRFHLSDKQFGRITSSSGNLKGQDIEISWNVGEELLSFRGTIIRIGAQISQTTGGISIFANINNEDRFSTLRPGAFVKIALNDKFYENAVRLPEDALYENNIVYAIVNQRLEPRKVTIVGTIDGDVIIQNGLKNDEQILTTWFAEAGPGLKVRVYKQPDRKQSNRQQPDRQQPDRQAKAKELFGDE